jgi:hypothetical protein
LEETMIYTDAVVYLPTITPASVGATTVAEQTFTVTGLDASRDIIVAHNVPSISNAVGVAGVRISADNTLAIRFVNPTAGALTPTAGVHKLVVARSKNDPTAAGDDV